MSNEITYLQGPRHSVCLLSFHFLPSRTVSLQANSIIYGRNSIIYGRLFQKWNSIYNGVKGQYLAVKSTMQIKSIRGFFKWYALYKFTFYLLTYLLISKSNITKSSCGIKANYSSNHINHINDFAMSITVGVSTLWHRGPHISYNIMHNRIHGNNEAYTHTLHSAFDRQCRSVPMIR